MAICRHCNAEVSDGATFCPVCGKPVMKKKRWFFALNADWKILSARLLRALRQQAPGRKEP